MGIEALSLPDPELEFGFAIISMATSEIKIKVPNLRKIINTVRSNPGDNMVSEWFKLEKVYINSLGFMY
jgi:hypothetical protein